jgi:nitrogen regulatory protein PII
MKAIIIAYYEAMDDEVIALLEKSGVMNYTKWTKVLGKGSGSGAHMLTNVWPKGNNVLFCVVEDEVAAPLFEKLKILRQKYRAEGLKVFQFPIEVVT